MNAPATDARPDLSLRRVPWVTAIVFAVTAAVNIAQLTRPVMLRRLERTPAGLHDEWWRSGTSLLTQDGGAYGTVSNLLFLVVLGIAAEQVARRWQWLAAYLGAAVIGQVAAYSWQPVGAGNSIAVCGLAALIIMWAWRGRPGLGAYAAPAALLWCGVLLATWNFWLVLVGVALVMAAPRLDLTRPRWRWGALAVAVAIGAFLCAVRNIHGAALLAGLVIAYAMIGRTAPAHSPRPADRVQDLGTFPGSQPR